MNNNLMIKALLCFVCVGALMCVGLGKLIPEITTVQIIPISFVVSALAAQCYYLSMKKPEETETVVEDGPCREDPHYYFHDYVNGMAAVVKVEFRNKLHTNADITYNYINREGKIISEKWFDLVGPFNEWGCGIIKINDKYNIISKDGVILSNNWYDDIGEFSDGVAKVYWGTDNTINYIDATGNLIWAEWKEESAEVRKVWEAKLAEMNN